MFTGIVEEVGRVVEIVQERTNIHFTIQSAMASELQIDQSVAHNGCCLTVVELMEDSFRVTAIQETLDKTNLSEWKAGTQVNLERCLKVDGRLDGHMVQGHVDTVGVCESVEDLDGSWKYTFTYESDDVTVDKGSIAVNGTSLTVVDSMVGKFSVCIIPYTYEYTNFNQLKKGDKVNLEFDILGKYVRKIMQLDN